MNPHLPDFHVILRPDGWFWSAPSFDTPGWTETLDRTCLFDDDWRARELVNRIPACQLSTGLALYPRPFHRHEIRIRRISLTFND